MSSFEQFRRGYANLWAKARIDPEREAQLRDIVANRILPRKARYLWAERATGVPWTWWAAIHYRESGNDFARNMVNGQRLSQVTTIVPKGLGPYASWENSVRDAVRHHALHEVADWSVPRWLYEAERYNGFGYMRPGIAKNSPYVWAFTNLSDERGKFVADGKYSASAPEKQAGVAALLLKLIEMDADARAWAEGAPAPKPAPTAPDETPTEPAEPAADDLAARFSRIAAAAGPEAEISVTVTLKKKALTQTPDRGPGPRNPLQGATAMLQNIDGYKTYIVAGVVIALGLMEGPLGIDIPGVDIGDDWFNYVLTGAFGGSLRSALGKIV